MEVINIIKKPYRNARWHLAKLWLRIHPDVDVIGIAGSVGKTSAKEMLANILSSTYSVIFTKANLAPSFNIPLTVLRIRKQSKFIAEMSIDGPGQMEKHISLIQPRIGVITRLSLEHTDPEHFGSFERAIEEETKLLSSLPKYGWAVLNGDDETIRGVANKAKCTRLTYGFREDNDIVISDCETSFSSGADVATNFSLKIGGIKRKFQIDLLGDTNVLAATAGICVGMITGMSFDQIRKGLLLSKPVRGRLMPIKGKWGMIIDDCYNASPAAVTAAIDLLVKLDANATLVFGDMLELGDYSDEEHRKIGEYAKKAGIKRLVTYGNQAKKAFNNFSGEKFHAPSYESAYRWLKLHPSKITLVKGSHGLYLENLVAMLTE